MDNKVIIIIAAVLVFVVGMYNIMLKKKNKVKTSFSSLYVMLKKRYDVMPNLVSMVQKYMAHESELLKELAEIRTGVENAKTQKEKLELGAKSEKVMKKVQISMESNPDLKSNQNMLHMQAVLNNIEEEIAAARRAYNAQVEDYNTFIGMIPFNIFALILGFRKFDQFTITNEERESRNWMG